MLVLTWGLRHFWKIWNIRKGCVTIEDWDFKKILCKACLLFNCFLVIKGILKALFSFIPWLLNFSDLSNYNSNFMFQLSYYKMEQSLLAPDFKNHMRNLDNFRQEVESPKSSNSMGYICLKATFLHLKHYLQIYLTLLSTDL